MGKSQPRIELDGYLIQSFGIWRAYVPGPGRIWTGPGAGHPKCEVCKGQACLGGFHVKCLQRDTKPSHIAGIINKAGELRVVVTQRKLFRHHVLPGERLIVRDDVMTWEPVPWDLRAALIYDTWKYVLRKLAPDNACGACRACCTTLRIVTDHWTKPSHKTCDRCADVGCTIYWNRPKECREFECVWLASQKRNDRMPPELRPDKCGVIFVGWESIAENGPERDPLVFEVHPNYPGAENNPEVRRYVDDMQAAGWKAKLIARYEGES